MEPPQLVSRYKQDIDGRRNIDHLTSRPQLAVFLIDRKDDHIVRHLIPRDQVLAGWVKGKIPRNVSLRGHYLNPGKRAPGGVDGENSNAVVTAIGGIKKPAGPI